MLISYDCSAFQVHTRLLSVLVMHQDGGGGGGGVGHRVGILTFSKKNYQNPHPRVKSMVFFSSSLCN